MSGTRTCPCTTTTAWSSTDAVVNYALLADTVLVAHFLFAAFLLLGLLLILLGRGLHWHWVSNPWFRWAHLAGVGIVVLQAWIGMICPVTGLEMWLRQQAGDSTYEGAFIAHWLSELLYYDFPPWVFILAYTLFGLLVLVSWLLMPPARFRR